MPVGVSGARGGHAGATLADEDHRVVVGQHPANAEAVISPTEWPAVTPTVAGRVRQGAGQRQRRVRRRR